MSCHNAQLRVLFPSLFLGLVMIEGCATRAPAHREAALAKPGAAVCSQPNLAVEEYFGRIDWIKKNHPELALILKKFPKGADLHNHLSGSVMPEEYLALGSAKGDCFGPEDPKTPNLFKIVSAKNGACPDGFKPLKQADAKEQQLLLRSLSMYQFNDRGPTAVQAGHDQFFATFVRFGAESGSPDNIGPMLAKLLQQAQSDGVGYMETMASFQSAAIGGLANTLRKQYPDPAAFSDRGNYPAMLNDLQREGLKNAVAAARKDVATYLDQANRALGCGAATADPACEVAFGFQAAANRNSSLPDGSPDLAKMFTQIALSSTLADLEPRVVGVNLVSGEDAPVSMSSFKIQMQFFAFFHDRFPKVNIALHGGELTPCFAGADPSAMKDHIAGAIQAGAKRVGHAVSFAFLNDRDKDAVAGLMRQNHILVEVPLTSNAQILGVAGAVHPFEQYFRRYKVPVAFSTDDEGVSYADYTSEWIYAVGQYHLTYIEAVKLARASLEYSFLSGESLWLGDGSKIVGQCEAEILGVPDPKEPCKSFLLKNPKAKIQWRYEEKLAAFDREYGSTVQRQFDSIN